MKVAIGKGIELDVNHERFNADVLAHVIYIGLRNVLMDSHASHTKEADGDNFVANSRATAERKLEAMYNGEVRAIGQREGDPVKAEAIRIATGHIKTALRKAGRKLADVDAKVIREKALDLIARNPSITVQAEKRVAELKATTVDLGDIEI
jgi:hypothetical protein